MYPSRRALPASAQAAARASAEGSSQGWSRWRLGAADAGMATAEYAVVTVAACGFAGLLVAILRSDEVRGLLLGIIRSALAR